MNWKQLSTPRRSGGIALVVALIILLVLTLLGVAMMNSSGVQERMSGNQKRIADSSMAAEGALQEHLGWLRADPSQHWGGVHPDQGQFLNYGFSGSSRFVIDSWESFGNSPAACTASDTRCILNVRGQSFAGQSVLAQTRLRAIVRYFFDLTPLGGDKDIWTSGDVSVNGNAYLQNTYAHVDGSLSEIGITGGNTTLTDSRITTNGTADINLELDDTDRCVDCSILDASTGFDDPMPPPDFALRIEEWRKEVAARDKVTFSEIADDGTFPAFADLDPAGGVLIANDITAYGGRDPVLCGDAQTFTLDASALQDGSVYFVNGNVDIQGGADTTSANVTVIATCNMTHNGAMRQTGGATAEINNVFYAGGDMIFNGATGQPPGTEFQGRFFAGGNMTQNGRSLVTGQIIVNGDLTINGTFNFTGANSLGGGADTSVGDNRVVLLDWSQVWN